MGRGDPLLSQSVTQVIEMNRKILFTALDSIEGKKTIVWDGKPLMRKLGLFANPAILKEHGVEVNLGLYQDAYPQTQNVLFFISPTVRAVDDLCKYMKAMRNEKCFNYVFFIPEMWFVARERLNENKEVASRIESVQHLPVSWLPSNGDVVSLNLPQLPSRLLLNGDWTYLHKCATALAQLDAFSAQPLAMFAKGKWAVDVVKMVDRMRKQQDDSLRPAVSSIPSISRIVVVDRWLDPLTPLLTQLTYGGLLDELYGIGLNGSIKVLESKFKEEPSSDADTTAKDINLSDELFDRLKFAHINAFGQEMATILQEIRTDEQYDKDKMSIAEYQVIVKKMPIITRKKNLASQHMRLAEISREELFDKLVDTVRHQKELLELCDGDKVYTSTEDAIIDCQPLDDVLRLVSIQSISSGGLKATVLNQYDRMILQSYGVEGMTRALKMRKLGLIREKGGAKMTSSYPPMQFAQLKKSYRLLSDADEMSQSDLGYAYSGYTPYLVRVIEEGATVKWTGWHAVAGGTSDGSGTAIFIVGGVTRAEVASLRLLPGVALVASSDVITGNKIIDNITNIVE